MKEVIFVIMKLVYSSNLSSVGYENGVLEIHFHSGGIYQYDNVPRSVYEALLAAPSKGKYFHKHIKDNYRPTRLR